MSAGDPQDRFPLAELALSAARLTSSTAARLVYDEGMSILNPTPPEKLVDAQGRPYFLWDCEMNLQQFRHLLEAGTLAERAYLVGKLMRQAKPDDVFTFVRLADIAELWPTLRGYLGTTRPFWTWILNRWGVDTGDGQ